MQTAVILLPHPDDWILSLQGICWWCWKLPKSCGEAGQFQDASTRSIAVLTSSTFMFVCDIFSTRFTDQYGETYCRDICERYILQRPNSHCDRLADGARRRFRGRQIQPSNQRTLNIGFRFGIAVVHLCMRRGDEGSSQRSKFKKFSIHDLAMIDRWKAAREAPFAVRVSPALGNCKKYL